MTGPDLVYVVGGPGDREDLRHSLRTIEANLDIPFRDVWVVGDPPAWFRGRSLPLTPDPEKFRNQRQSLTAYVKHPDAAETFVLLNDDMFITEPSSGIVTARKAVPFSVWSKQHLETIARKPHKWDCWNCSILDTAQWVADRAGIDPFIYECHTPLMFDTAKVRHLLADYPADSRFLIGELYPLAGVGGEGENRGNAKCGSPATFADKLALPMPYLSCSPDTWDGCVGDYIRERFTAPSRWEDPVLDADAITDQKRAPGLIENPCRDVLIDLASRVPADEAIVELGSFKGRSTAHLALGSSRGHEAPVHAFDPWELAPPIDPDYLVTAGTIREYSLPETREAFERHMRETGATAYVTAHQMTGIEGAKQWDGPKIGLLFHDALHDYDSVFANLKAWLPHMAKHAVVVLHDTDDVRYQVLEAAEDAFTRTITLSKRWDWAGRELHPWAKNEGKLPERRRRGFVVVRTKG